MKAILKAGTTISVTSEVGPALKRTRGETL